MTNPAALLHQEAGGLELALQSHAKVRKLGVDGGDPAAAVLPARGAELRLRGAPGGHLHRKLGTDPDLYKSESRRVGQQGPPFTSGGHMLVRPS